MLVGKLKKMFYSNKIKLFNLFIIVIGLNACTYSTGVTIPFESPDFFHHSKAQKIADENFYYFKNKKFRFNIVWCDFKYFQAKKKGRNLIVDECKKAYKFTKEKCFIEYSIKHCRVLHHLSSNIFNNKKITKRVETILEVP